MPGWLDGAYTQRSGYGFPPGAPPDRAPSRRFWRGRGRGACRFSAGEDCRPV